MSSMEVALKMQRIGSSLAINKHRREDEMGLELYSMAGGTLCACVIALKMRKEQVYCVRE